MWHGKRQAMVRDVITALTPEQLDENHTRTEPGWPQLEDFPLAQCLFIVVNEEWHHRLPPNETWTHSPRRRSRRTDMDIVLIAGMWLDATA